MNSLLKGLYIVTPDWDDLQRLLDVTELALRGGAALVQYRHKTASPQLRESQAERLLELCREYRRPLIINDFIELAISLDADGIHVGGTDMPVAEARELLGPDKIIGASCYGSMEMARNAHLSGASYVALGGFYPSRVKKYEATTPPAIISRAKAELPLPVAVIGGMTQKNAQPLIQAGTDMVAAISSIYSAPDPEAAAREFVRMFRS